MPSAAPGSVPHAYGSGFLNRLATALDGTAAPVSFTDGLPLVLTGGVPVPNVSLKGTGRAPFDDRQVALLSSMYAGTRFEPLIAEGFDLRKTVAEEAEMMAKGDAGAGMSAEMIAANRNALTAKGFELEARRAWPDLMLDKFNVAFIGVGGWDTHVNPGRSARPVGGAPREPWPGPGGIRRTNGNGLEPHRRRGVVGVRAHIP